jgi:hypothetical protein
MVAPGCARPNTPRSDPKDMSQLAEPLRSRLATMMADLGGLVLVSGYRDAGRQWDLRRERCPGRECSRSCKGYPTTALPGSSNHQRRTAADIGGRNLNAANRVKAAYGLHTPVPGEPWHFEATAKEPTKTIRPFGPPAPPKPVEPNAGRVWRTVVAGADDRTIYKLGGRDNQVAELQMLTGNRVTGTYDEATVRTVVALKTKANWLTASGSLDTTSRVDERLINAIRALAAAKK